MGCTSSTENVTDPFTGDVIEQKKKLGGSYPGNRRPVNDPVAFDESAFQGGVSATATDNYDKMSTPTAAIVPTPEKEYLSVTIPQGVCGGDEIQVKSTDGRLKTVVVPKGMFPGSTFTVEFELAHTTETSNISDEKIPLVAAFPVNGTSDDQYVSMATSPYPPSKY